MLRSLASTSWAKLEPGDLPEALKAAQKLCRSRQHRPHGSSCNFRSLPGSNRAAVATSKSLELMGIQLVQKHELSRIASKGIASGVSYKGLRSSRRAHASHTAASLDIVPSGGGLSLLVQSLSACPSCNTAG